MSPMNNRLLRPTSNYDADALRYINAVQVADGQALEPEVRTAIDAFVRGCKSDSAGYAGDPTRTLWDALQACCIMAGARTISGALVPLKGAAPTPYNFVSDDYDRSTGLQDPGAASYLDSNRLNNADGQNDFHIAGYSSSFSGPYFVAAGGSDTGTSMLGSTSRSRTGTAYDTFSVSDGFTGHSRSEASKYIFRTGGLNAEVTTTSETPSSLSLLVFARGTAASPLAVTGMPISFYSIGSALDLAALDTRVSTLISSISTALS